MAFVSGEVVHVVHDPVTATRADNNYTLNQKFNILVLCTRHRKCYRTKIQPIPMKALRASVFGV